MLIDKNNMDVFSSVCSICCDSADIIRNVNSDEAIRKQFNIMIETCFRQEFVEEEDMPSVFLCNDCCEKLIRFNNFKELFMRNVLHLRYLKVQEPPGEEVVELEELSEIDCRRNEEVDVVKNEVNGFYDDEDEMGSLGSSNVGAGMFSLGNEGVMPDPLGVVERPGDDVELEAIPDPLDVASGMSSEVNCRKNEEVDVMKNEVHEFHLDEDEMELVGSNTVAAGMSSSRNEGCAVGMRLGEVVVKEEEVDVGDDEKLGFGNTVAGIRTRRGDTSPDFLAYGHRHVKTDDDRTNREVPPRNTTVKQPEKQFNFLSSANTNASIRPGRKRRRTPIDRQPICQVCGKTFRRFSTVKVHMRIHTGDKPHTCQSCGRKFRQRQDLARHMRVHTREKPYGCLVCGNRFCQSASLRRHMRIHTEEKPYGCEVCGKKFRESSRVTVHMRTHTKDKPYACKICGKTFSVSSNLTTHTRNVHTC